VGAASGSETFFSTAHGSGRTMSPPRRASNGTANNCSVIWRRAYLCPQHVMGRLAEEAGPAYKNIDEVIAAAELAGISKPWRDSPRLET